MINEKEIKFQKLPADVENWMKRKRKDSINNIKNIDISLLREFLKNSIKTYYKINIFDYNIYEQTDFVKDFFSFINKHRYNKHKVFDEIERFKIFSYSVIFNDRLNNRLYPLKGPYSKCYINFNSKLTKNYFRLKDLGCNLQDDLGNIILPRLFKDTENNYLLYLYKNNKI